MNDDKFQALLAREQDIGALRDDPAFQALRLTVTELEERFWRRFTEAARRGQPLDPAFVEAQRNRFRGAWEVLDEPHGLQTKLQRELEKRA